MVDLLNPKRLAGDASEPLLRGKKEKTLVADLEKKFNDARQARLPFERQWYVNMSFYAGKQWVVWAPNTANGLTRLYTPPAPPWRVRLTSNKIRPIIRKEMAKILKEKPIAYVQPATTDEEDIQAARAAEKLNEHLTEVLNIHNELKRAVFWMVLTGVGFIKDWWDPEEADFDGKPGSIKLEKISPFHILIPNPETEELERQPWVIHTIAKDVEEASDEWGVKLEPDASSNSGLIEHKFTKAIGLQESNYKKQVAIKEMWYKPCKKYPEGAVITWANGKLLQEYEGWPFQHGQYPFTKLEHIPAGRFYSTSVIEDLIPLQKEYNRTRSQIIEAKNRMSKPQLVAARGSVDPGKMTSEPGLVIEYTPGFQPPTPLPLQNLPSYVLQELDRTQIDMNDVSSQHEVSKGQTPPNVEAATAIAYLQEQDDTVLSMSIESKEQAIQQLSRHVLSHVQQFWNIERTFTVGGNSSELEVMSFSSASIQGAVDLRIQPGSAMPQSRAAKQAFLIELFDKGALPPDRLLRYLELDETQRMYEEAQIDSRHAQRENLKLSQGERLNDDPDDPLAGYGPNTWDNHEIHIMEHNNYRKRAEYELLPREVKQIFQFHVAAHEQALQAQQMQQDMMGPEEDVEGEEPPQEEPEPGGEGAV